MMQAPYQFDFDLRAARFPEELAAVERDVFIRNNRTAHLRRRRGSSPEQPAAARFASLT
jgi:hypothetical protein